MKPAKSEVLTAIVICVFNVCRKTLLNFPVCARIAESALLLTSPQTSHKSKEKGVAGELKERFLESRAAWARVDSGSLVPLDSEAFISNSSTPFPQQVIFLMIVKPVNKVGKGGNILALNPNKVRNGFLFCMFCSDWQSDFM